MNWVLIVWPMIASACLTLAGMHVLIWFRNHQARANLAFSLLAFCVAVVAGFELAMMRASTVEQFGLLQRWLLVTVFVGIVAILAFVQLYLHSGRRWLAHATWVTRLIGLVITFSVQPNIFYREITQLDRIDLWGSPVVVARAVPGPWLWVDQVGALLLVVFAADAALTLWRRGDAVQRRRALVVGGSLTLFLLLACTQVALVHSQVIAAPYLVSVPFLIMVAAMGYELSRDVLRAAQLAAQLRESEQRMELAANAAHLGLWVWEIPADEIWGTANARALFGFDLTERIDFARFEAAMQVDDRAAVGQAVRRALDGDGEYQAEFRIPLPDQSVRWIAARGRVEFNERHQPLRMRGTVMDISQLKQAELDARQARDALAHATRVATMGELSASLAHELNQPLSAILSNAQAAQRFLATDSPEIAEVRGALADIADDSQRAGEVIRRLRAMVKRTGVEWRPVQIERVVGAVVRLLRSDAVMRGVTVAVDIAPGLPAVRGDEVQLQQVILNLLLNAFDAVSEAAAPPARTITVRAVATESEAVRVSVEDHGTGLRDELRQRLFEPFHTTKSHGLGMGLAISRSIVEAHGGQLWGENNPDQGATFHFELPVATDRQ